MDILSVKNLKKYYHTKTDEILAVENFSYNIKKGDFIAIVGPSGCGKSTILSCLCDLEKISDGEIIKDNINFGYMLQTDSLFENRNILDNCLLGLEIQNKKNDKNIKYVKELLINYGLKDFLEKKPKCLSGGMRQRVL